MESSGMCDGSNTSTSHAFRVIDMREKVESIHGETGWARRKKN